MPPSLHRAPPSPATPDVAARTPDGHAADRARLEAARRDVLAAIRAYPAPITACDAQFNHLLEERDRLAAELRRLDTAGQ